MEMIKLHFDSSVVARMLLRAVGLLRMVIMRIAWLKMQKQTMRLETKKMRR